MTTQPSTGPRPRTEAGRSYVKGTLLGKGGVTRAILAIEAEARAAALTAVEEAVRADVIENIPSGSDAYRAGWGMGVADVLAVLAKLQEDEQ